MKYKPLTSCPYCKEELQDSKKSANHIRWCKDNPSREKYKEKLAINRKNAHNPEAIQQRVESLKKAHADGKYKNLDYSWNKGRKHSAETKETLRKKALASKHRRLVRSVRDYVKKDGTVVKLDSFWEESLAKRLDLLNIEWIRPDEPIIWKDKNGQDHNYFPDFYLPKYNLFLDPKNSYARANQKEKLDILTTMMDNLIIITTLEECLTFKI